MWKKTPKYVPKTITEKDLEQSMIEHIVNEVDADELGRIAEEIFGIEITNSNNFDKNSFGIEERVYEFIPKHDEYGESQYNNGLGEFNE